MGPLETCQSPTKLVSVQNSVTLGQSPMNIDRGSPKIWGTPGAPPFGIGEAWPTSKWPCIAEFGLSRSNHMGVGSGGDTGSAPWDGEWLIP